MQARVSLKKTSIEKGARCGSQYSACLSAVYDREVAVELTYTVYRSRLISCFRRWGTETR